MNRMTLPCRPPLSRRHLALAGLGLALPALVRPAPARAQPRQYRFNEQVGRLAFTARHFGLLSSTGSFGRFDAEVALDPLDPGKAEINVSVATGSIDLGWPGAADLLRSPAYFDAEAHPMARFTGLASGGAQPDRFRIEGQLTLRGVTRPMVMQARLLRRQRNPAEAGEIAEFTASGALDRTAFGMLEDRTTISDQVRLDVQVRLLMAPA